MCQGIARIIAKEPARTLQRVLPDLLGQAIAEIHFPDRPEGKYVVAPDNPGFA